MAGKILLSTAYLPPIEYFAQIAEAERVLIEKEENYLKQSYRNRCYILSANGTQQLTVPVYLGSLHKTPVKEIKIDYSKRWQQVHLRALHAAYKSSPFFIFYIEALEKIILSGYELLIDLNTDLLKTLVKMAGIESRILYTIDFVSIGKQENDFRYTISPKRESDYNAKEYIQVFRDRKGFVPGLSIVDLLFNVGPEIVSYL
jgi:hypothetical protein